ncbi:hypothetical protein M434DRAFT_8791 [Hypoxylon sp. CO27-5]|nr:hypothetical protein M434DRAFT_8791 [Hypoxylon sp. CO27-5]
MQHLTDSLGDQDIPVALAAKPCEPPTDPTRFHEFPGKRGYRITQDFRIEEDESDRQRNYASFMQEWLFFGLILTTVRPGSGSTEGPFITREQLTLSHNVTTQDLPAALDQWEQYEARKLPGIEYRMIQTAYVLERARQIIRKNCAVREQKVLYSDNIHNRWYLSNKSALCLMTVGEILSAAKNRILENAGVKISGWHADDDAGWGPSNWIFKRMNGDGKGKRRWCQRAMYLLQGQLGANSTLMLAAYRRYENSDRMAGNKHRNCAESNCEVVEKEDHLGSCKNCDKFGPNMDDVLNVLRKTTRAPNTETDHEVPLLVFGGSEEEPYLRVENRKLNTKYAAISHVWSDGWGNEMENKISLCRLRYIRRQIKRLSDGNDRPFWMDTLVVPVDKTAENDRKIAIGQITNIFERSEFTIVLDNGLLSTPIGDKRAAEAMAVLPSIWMRRLWTLQEAFLSNKILFAFAPGSQNEKDLVDFDDLDFELNRGISNVAGAFDQAVRCQLSSQLMGTERADRKHHQRVRREKRRGPILVASAWSAARWRTTSNPAHEILALATLLGLDYQGTKIEEAGLKKDPADEFLNELVRDFWIIFDQQFVSAIPPGIIFLPGQKVEGFEGFGWAPKTWLSAHGTDYPNPLSTTRSPASLDKMWGLQVRYPGFLLHTEQKKTILGDGSLKEFKFPVDRSLMEWYSVKPADSNCFSDRQAFLNSASPLAIIISRPRPRGSRHEIGLLVEIYNNTQLQSQNDPGAGTNGNRVFYCQIISRVHVWREMREHYTVGHGNVTQFSLFPQDNAFRNIVCGPSPGNNDLLCIGEVVEETQAWYVDGYKRGRSKPIDDQAYNGPSITTQPTHLSDRTRSSTWSTLRSFSGNTALRKLISKLKTSRTMPPTPDEEDPPTPKLI